MRMRRKKHLDERLAACGDMIIFMDREDRDFSVKDTENMLDYKAIFGNDKPIVLEIGCGKGQFIRELAKRGGAAVQLFGGRKSQQCHR